MTETPFLSKTSDL